MLKSTIKDAKLLVIALRNNFFEVQQSSKVIFSNVLRGKNVQVEEIAMVRCKRKCVG